MTTTTDTEFGRHRRIRGRNFDTNDLASAALPYMSRMRHNVPGIHAVVLGTGDGIHVCSIGLKDSLDAARITALNSSMLGVSSAQAMVIDPLKNEDQDTIVTVAMPGDEFIALAKIEHAPSDTWCSASSPATPSWAWSCTRPGRPPTRSPSGCSRNSRP